MRGSVGDDSRFVRRELGLVWLGRTEQEAQRDQCANQTENYQNVDQKWDVALEQVSEAASGVGAFRNATNSKRTAVPTCPSDLSGVFSPVLDVDAPTQRGVDGAVAVAGHVDRRVHLLIVVLPVPADQERDLDLLERAGPFLLLLTFDDHFQRLERLLELLEQQHDVQPRARAECAEKHL